MGGPGSGRRKGGGKSVTSKFKTGMKAQASTNKAAGKVWKQRVAKAKGK